jgi:hypothetical protein
VAAAADLSAVSELAAMWVEIERTVLTAPTSFHEGRELTKLTKI